MHLMHLLIGPPASGKTTRLLQEAQQVLRQKQRVWWLGLPHQRSYIYRRVASDLGPSLGLEVLTLQRMYYRLLAANFGLRPILTGPGRVALVGEALMDGERLPSPGEARLFSRAIAEAKRFGLGPNDLPILDSETRRLRRCYSRYEELKGAWGRWDYDDFRSAALQLVENHPYNLEEGLGLVVLDGLREITPLELRFLRALSQKIKVWVSLPQGLPGLASESTPYRSLVEHKIYRATNPVAEARWVMRSVKRDLALGLAASDIALIAPQGRHAALLSLAQEYGIPLQSAAPVTAANTPEGRLLLNLLDLPDYPSPSRLLAIAELAPLGRAALEQGIGGREAMLKLAHELGLGDFLRNWLDRLEPSGDLEVWARSLLNSLPQITGPYKELLLERAKEAVRIAVGADFRHWWAALISETYQAVPPPAGVALLPPNLAGGVRYSKLYLLHAVEGAYGGAEHEDYFVPEEFRLPLASLLERVGLPHRLQGRDLWLLQELRSRAANVVITYSAADPSGPLQAEPHLVTNPQPLPTLPPSSPLEGGEPLSYQAPLGTALLPLPLVEGLRHYNECGFRFWAQHRLGHTSTDEWQVLIKALHQIERLNPARLESLKTRFPTAAGWLEAHQETLNALTFGLRFPARSEIQAHIDAGSNRQGKVSLYSFCPPIESLNPHVLAQQARRWIGARWSEVWAAGQMLEHTPQQVKTVVLWVWPVLGSPVQVFPQPLDRASIRSQWGWRQNKIDTALERFKSGVFEPNPGFHCRGCPVRDVCRKGKD